MNDISTPSNSNTSWWITSLAISVICCAVLFVVFASYLFAFREKMGIVEIRLNQIEQQEVQQAREINNLNRKTTVQQIQILPPGSASQNIVPTVIPDVIGREGGASMVPLAPSPAPGSATESGRTSPITNDNPQGMPPQTPQMPPQPAVR